MSLQKYLQTISKIDTGNIYVENIRSAMDISTSKARVYCEMAVVENIFVKKIGVLCPNENRIIQEFDNENEIPETITCHICEDEDKEQSTFNTANLKRIIYYKLTE